MPAHLCAQRGVGWTPQERDIFRSLRPSRKTSAPSRRVVLRLALTSVPLASSACTAAASPRSAAANNLSAGSATAVRAQPTASAHPKGDHFHMTELLERARGGA